MKDSVNKRIKKYKTRSRIFLVIGIIIVIISPVVFTQIAFFKIFDLSSTGSIGDTIGGITAPIVNIIAAVLIYFSFEQQIEANKIQRDALDIQIKEGKRKDSYQILETHLTEIKEEFYKIRYSRLFEISKIPHEKLGEIYYGEDAISAYAEDIEQYKDEIYLDVVSFEYYIKYLILLIDSFDKRLDKSSLTKNDKKYLAKKLIFFYSAKIEFHIESIIRVSKFVEKESEEYYQINKETISLKEIIDEMYEKYKIDSEIFEE